MHPFEFKAPTVCVLEALAGGGGEVGGEKSARTNADQRTANGNQRAANGNQRTANVQLTEKDHFARKLGRQGTEGRGDGVVPAAR